jgi:hypothetical protein
MFRIGGKMLRKSLFIFVFMLLAAGMVGAVVNWMPGQASDGEQIVCPPGFKQIVGLDPIQEGSKTYNLGCEEIVEGVFLSPIGPGDFGWEIKPYEPDEKSEIMMGPSHETGYRCIYFMDPIQPGEDASMVSEPVCGEGLIETVGETDLSSSFLIARFYDNTNYNSLLVEYFGPAACSSSVSYGVTVLPSGLDNRFSSGRSYSNCNLIHVYDFFYYGPPTYSCGPNCPSFHALNNQVSSWTTNQ